MQVRHRPVAGALGPVQVQRCEKQGKGRRWVQRGVRCLGGCSSVLSSLCKRLYQVSFVQTFHGSCTQMTK